MCLRGTKIAEAVTEVGWSGGKLPDPFYDEFVFIGAIGDDLKPGDTISFPVVQEWEKGVNRWIEIPAADGSRGSRGTVGPRCEAQAATEEVITLVPIDHHA